MRDVNWLAWRQGGIGGSDAPAVMGTSPWTSPLKLWELKTGRREPDKQTYPMLRGLRLEPVARALYEEETGVAMPAPGPIQHPKIDYIRVTLDGLNKKLRKGIEIKCPGRVDHATAVRGEIPEKYLYQCVHNCMAADLDSLDYFSYDGKGNGVIVPFERNLKLEKKLLLKEEQFWECVQRDIPPHKRKELIMNGNKGPYTAREVFEILQEAKRLGATFLKLEGFEAAFDLTGATSQSRQTRSYEQVVNSKEPEVDCGECGATMVEGYRGLYCKRCYVARKELEKKASFFKVRRYR